MTFPRFHGHLQAESPGAREGRVRVLPLRPFLSFRLQCPVSQNHDQAPGMQEAMRRLAKQLPTRRPFGWFLRPVPVYELMSGGLLWSDERPAVSLDHDAIEWDAFRLLLAHRTDSMMGRGDRFPQLWRVAKELCPRWIGFRRERCVSTPESITVLEEGERQLDRQIRICERRWDREDRERDRCEGSEK